MANDRRIPSIVAAMLCLAGTAACDHSEPGEPQLDPVNGQSGSWTIMGR